MSADRIITKIISAEGGYANDPNDLGGETMYGVTVETARANGYLGPMKDMPRSVAEKIYRKRFWEDPGFDKISALSPVIAEELADSGVNFGPHHPCVWLQRWLNVFNRQGTMFRDIAADGKIGPNTLFALKTFLNDRGKDGEKVLLVALNCSQGARYLELAEGREKNEEFVYGWVRGRVVEQVR